MTSSTKASVLPSLWTTLLIGLILGAGVGAVLGGGAGALFYGFVGLVGAFFGWRYEAHRR
ncbi:hypothetical protein K6U06_07215 [Acidiferrimicrobium sp. IK]|uniref:hypothetical protein n=1 Tax=Acidiferrimicrobium sp. IK TaxID=2871700 RepID=UPI0021CB4FD7|nr:hypothetical protein [Acidiferrimicrobium sp. IK]MCU4184144.1 hypothetical protein [Acidiferrimicrobium sp. IK]